MDQSQGNVMNLSKQTPLYTTLFWLVSHLCNGFHHAVSYGNTWLLKQIPVRPFPSLTLSPS